MQSKIAVGYIVAVNVAAFILYGADKWRAQHGRWRISEATLLLMAAAGGSIGAWVGMRVWHHKTRHPKFRYGVPLILAAQVVLLLLVGCSSYKPPADEVYSTSVSWQSRGMVAVHFHSVGNNISLCQE